MGFFNTSKMPAQALPAALLHKMECRACPLNKVGVAVNAHIAPQGSAAPLVYILGSAPDSSADHKGLPFSGAVASFINQNIPKEYKNLVRFNNVVRTRPPKGRKVQQIEIECCRPSVAKDIEASKPYAIIGLGAEPLSWLMGQVGITEWRGRRIPVKIKSHVCWFYPTLDPLTLGEFYQGGSGVSSEDQRALQFDFKKVFFDLKEGLPASVHDTSKLGQDIVIIKGDEFSAIEKVRAFFESAKSQKVVGIDYETNRLRPYNEGSKILSAGVWAETSGMAIAFDHPQAGWSRKDRKELDKLWISFLKECKGSKAVHNLAFEMEWSAQIYDDWSLLSAGRWDCTMVQAAVLDERVIKRAEGPLSLAFLTQQYFGFNIKQVSAVNRKDLENCEISEVLRYNGIDAKYHALLYKEQRARLKSEKLTKVYNETVRRTPALVKSQIKGLLIDLKVNRQLRKKHVKESEQAINSIQNSKEVQLFKSLKRSAFNPLSNYDLTVLFRDILKRPEGRRDKGSGYSVDETTLLQIGGEFCGALLNYRKAQKLISTYIEPYANVYQDNRIHPVFNSVYAETGRLSAESPNVQNIPKRSVAGREIRRQLVADEGCVIVAADYGQLEARVAAMASRDKIFTRALWEGFDIHGDWARRIALTYPQVVGGKSGLEDKQKMKDFRTVIKNKWTFPLIFGASTSSVAGYLGVPENITQLCIDQFWREFPGLEAWQTSMIQFYRRNGYCETLTGRRRRAPLSRNRILNSPIQGTAAEIVMDAMARLSEKEEFSLQPNIQIHDDLTFIIPKSKLDYCLEIIVTEMLTFEYDFINCPMVVEVSVGKNMAEMEEVLVASSDKW